MDSNLNANRCCKRQHRHGLTFSIVLIVIGLIFLGVNTGLLPILYKPLFSSWPIWCIFIGLYLLLERSWFSASVLLTAGIFFVIPQIGAINPTLNIPADFAHIYWPVLLIVAGIYVALGRVFGRRCRKWHHTRFHDPDFYTSKDESADGFVRMHSSFDSRKNIVLDPVFKGGEVECNFGEVILDLRKTALPEGKTTLNVRVSFGSVVVIVPDGWNVQLLGESMFGSFTDGRLTRSYLPNENRMLLIDGKCSFGECRIKD